MTTPRNPDRVMSAWLEEGPNELPEATRRAIAVDIQNTHQRRRGLIAPWGTNASGMARLVLATIAVLVALGGGLFLFGNRSDGLPGQVGGAPPPSSSPSSTAPDATSSSAAPAMVKTFASSLHGYSVGYPEGWTPIPATALWEPSPASEGSYDRIINAPDGGMFRVTSALIPDGVSTDDWIDQFMTQADDPGCAPVRSTQPVIVIDGQRGRIRDSCGEVEATVVVGRRVYLFTLFLGDGLDRIPAANARAVFDAFATTIDLRPEDGFSTPSPASS
jgi:hypothetical protein